MFKFKTKDIEEVGLILMSITFQLILYCVIYYVIIVLCHTYNYVVLYINIPYSQI